MTRGNERFPLTDNHQREMKATFGDFPMDLVRKIRETYVVRCCVHCTSLHMDDEKRVSVTFELDHCIIILDAD